MTNITLADYLESIEAWGEDEKTLICTLWMCW